MSSRLRVIFYKHYVPPHPIYVWACLQANRKTTDHVADTIWLGHGWVVNALDSQHTVQR